MKKLLNLLMGIALLNTFSLSASSIFGESAVASVSIIDTTFTVTVLPSPIFGGETIPYGDTTIIAGNSLTITAIPDPDFNFYKWTIDGATFFSDENPYTFQVQKSCIIRANFTHKVTLSESPINGGTITKPTLNFDHITHGTEIKVTANANSCYSFVNWTEDNIELSTNSAYTFTVTKHRNIVANFVKKPYKVNVTVNESNYGTADLHLIESETGCDSVEVKAFPNANLCFYFQNWSVDGVVVSEKNPYKFEITGNKTLTANFVQILYKAKVEVNDNDYGFVENTLIESCDSVEITAFPYDGFNFLNWTIENAVVSTNNPYKFKVSKDMTITANFDGLDFDTYVGTFCCSPSCCNTFMLNMKKLTDDGYEVLECKWLKNQTVVIDQLAYDEFSYSAGSRPTDCLEPTCYTFQIITKNAGIRCSSKKNINYSSSSKSCASIANKTENLIAYPNPVTSGMSLTIEGAAKNTPINLYNYLGTLLYSSTASNSIIELTLDFPPGIYLLRTENKIVKIVIVK